VRKLPTVEVLPEPGKMIDPGQSTQQVVQKSRHANSRFLSVAVQAEIVGPNSVDHLQIAVDMSDDPLEAAQRGSVVAHRSDALLTSTESEHHLLFGYAPDRVIGQAGGKKIRDLRDLLRASQVPGVKPRILTQSLEFRIAQKVIRESLLHGA